MNLHIRSEFGYDRATASYRRKWYVSDWDSGTALHARVFHNPIFPRIYKWWLERKEG